MRTALYIHFPFCVQKCRYCDFNSVADTQIDAGEYVAGLTREMTLRARMLTAPVSAPTLYFGGGTPSLLPPRLVGALVETATRLFGLDADAEITLEANPGTVTPDTLAGYRAAGVNRLSFGVQTFNDPLLARLGRLHTAAEAIRGFEAARAAGFGNVGIDLMHSLPGEDLSHWQDDLKQGAALAPEHLSVYALSVEEGTPFHRLAQQDLLQLPDEDESAAMLEWTGLFLRTAGFDQYEIANFARPGFRSRHNLGYWRRANYLGFGAGAHSFLREPGSGRRWGNVPAPAPYLTMVASGTLPEVDPVQLTMREAMEEFLFLGLRVLDGVDGAQFRREFGISLPEAFPGEISRLVADGLLEQQGEYCRLTSRAVPVANRVFVRFV
jgi:oxygen-independent coproporphyrinogen-3 oxidase